MDKAIKEAFASLTKINKKLKNYYESPKRYESIDDLLEHLEDQMLLADKEYDAKWEHD